MASRMTAVPNSEMFVSDNAPFTLPIAVLAALAITTSLLIYYLHRAVLNIFIDLTRMRKIKVNEYSRNIVEQ